MTDDDTRVIIDPNDDDIPDTPAPARAPVAPASSILANIRQETIDQARDSTLVLSVGRSMVLGARYRVLEQDEIDTIGARATKVAKLERRKIEATDLTANLLAEACVELVWIDGWDEKSEPPSLVDVLAADGVDTQGDEPMRYDARTVSVLGLDLQPDDRGHVVPADVVIETHTWRTPRGSNLLPLAARAKSYDEWLEAEGLRAMEGAHSGN
jgi:hypothetical protein